MQASWLRLSLLQHYAYCPRQAWLLLDGVWSDSHHTLAGDLAHERVDSEHTDSRRGRRVHHRVELVSHRLGIHGLADSVEVDAAGELTPVEHKVGRGAGDLWPSAVQAVAQAICLREMTGAVVAKAVVYVVNERSRVEFLVDEQIPEVEALISRARTDLFDEAGGPDADYAARRCRSCSVAHSCQPGGRTWL